MERTITEYELKACAPPDERLGQLLSDFKKEGKEKFLEDVYFDTTRKELYKRGIFIRIRNNKSVDIKFNSDMANTEHLDCEETNFELPFSPSAVSSLRMFLRQLGIRDDSSASSNDGESILQSFGLFPFVTITKKRQSYTKPGVEFSVDDVNGLGKFIEIESVGEELSKKYQSWANCEGIMPIPVGYVELYLRKHDFPTYITGRYILDEDRI